MQGYYDNLIKQVHLKDEIRKSILKERQCLIQAFLKYKRELIFQLSVNEIMLLINHFTKKDVDLQKVDTFVHIIVTRDIEKIFEKKGFFLGVLKHFITKDPLIPLCEKEIEIIDVLYTFLYPIMTNQEKFDYTKELLIRALDQGRAFYSFEFLTNFIENDIREGKYESIIMLNNLIKLGGNQVINFIFCYNGLIDMLITFLLSSTISNKIKYSIWSLLFSITCSCENPQCFFELISKGIFKGIFQNEDNVLFFSISLSVFSKLLQKINVYCMTMPFSRENYLFIRAKEEVRSFKAHLYEEGINKKYNKFLENQKIFVLFCKVNEQIDIFLKG